MKQEELMIGDWIKVIPFHDEKRSYFKKIENGRDLDAVFDFQGHIKPIKITPEILVKNGFEKCEDSIMYVWKLSKLQCGTMSFYKTANKTLMFDITGNYLTHRKFSGELKYIHELQHTLKLCGFDKEIRL